MSDELKEAIASLNKAIDYANRDNFYGDRDAMVERYLRYAEVYGAIAQTAALERIANVLETMEIK